MRCGVSQGVVICVWRPRVGPSDALRFEQSHVSKSHHLAVADVDELAGLAELEAEGDVGALEVFVFVWVGVFIMIN